MIRTTSIGILVLAASAIAQPQGRGPGRFGAGPEPGGFGGRFLGAEAGMPGRVVKNAPYSAEVVTETTQALQDGNRIRQSHTVKVYRDAEGRTRNEQSLRNLNGLAPNSNLPELVFINDPVAGANYALNPAAKTATKSNWSRPGAGGENRPMGRGPGGPGGPRRPESSAGTPGQGQGQLQGRAQGEAPGRGPRRGQNIKTEALGTQMIEGVQAEGTRTTMTIPAGQVGNEQPIQIVSESWYSQELRMTVLAKRSDPRSGETITKMTNISRAEPPSTMFQVPVDFKINDIASRTGRTPRQ